MDIAWLSTRQHKTVGSSDIKLNVFTFVSFCWQNVTRTPFSLFSDLSEQHPFWECVCDMEKGKETDCWMFRCCITTGSYQYFVFMELNLYINIYIHTYIQKKSIHMYTQCPNHKYIWKWLSHQSLLFWAIHLRLWAMRPKLCCQSEVNPSHLGSSSFFSARLYFLYLPWETGVTQWSPPFPRHKQRRNKAVLFHYEGLCYSVKVIKSLQASTFDTKIMAIGRTLTKMSSCCALCLWVSDGNSVRAASCFSRSLVCSFSFVDKP